MSDLPSAPAAAGGEQSDSGRMDWATLSAQLAALDDELEGEAAAEPGESAQSPTEQPSDNTEAVAAAEDGEGEASEEDAEQPADDAETAAEKADSKVAEPELAEKIHGNTVTRLRDGTEVTLGELKRGYDELRDYRARMPELTAAAEKVKGLETREAQLAQQEQLYQTVVPLAFQFIQSRLPPAPDPALLDESSPNYDPIKWVQDNQRHNAAFAEIQQLHAGLQSQRQQQQQKAEEDREAELKKFVEANQQTLRSKIPDLADPVKGQEIYKELVNTVSKYGYTEQEIDRGYKLYDHKMLYMLHDLTRKAAAYDKLVAQKPAAAAKTKPATPVQQPGRRVSAEETESRAVNDSYNRWRREDRSMDGFLKILEKLPS